MFPLFYFIHISFFFSFFFFPLFFSPPHTYPYFFFFFIPFFPLFPYHFFHTRALTFFSLFPSFVFFPTTSHSQNVPHSLCPSLIPQSLCIFFFFFDNLKATRKRADGDDDDEDDWNIRKSLIHYNKSELWWQKHFVTICPYFVTNTYGDEMVTKQHSSPKLHHLMYWWWKCFVTKKKI